VTPNRVELWQVIEGNVSRLQIKCSIGMHNEVIWIVKDVQRVQVSAWVYGHHDKLLKYLTQFLTVMSNAAIVKCRYCRHTLQGSSQPQDENAIFRRAARNPC